MASTVCFPLFVGICIHTRSAADGYHGDGDICNVDYHDDEQGDGVDSDSDDGNCDGVGDSDLSA